MTSGNSEARIVRVSGSLPGCQIFSAQVPRPAVESGPGEVRSSYDQGFSTHNELNKPSSPHHEFLLEDSSS